MKTQWQPLLKTIVTWLFLEVVLSIAGVDELADYSEFMFNKHSVFNQSAKAVEVLPYECLHRPAAISLHIA
ncbi:hypothetical protein ACQ4M4_10460 [Leptolyngbya sp. AN02str]|uniref:hypothetical protein n=1 Tax=Leptolyngbya sp. AN02str TaxID=3423363 RepID=UPI003D315637